MAVITIPKDIREKLGDDGADALVEILNKVEESVKKDNISFVEEKFERGLSEEIGKVKVEIAETKVSIVKWMFIFWVGQIGVLTGILFAFFK